MNPKDIDNPIAERDFRNQLRKDKFNAHLRNRITLPFGAFEKYNLALMIIKKQQDLILLMNNKRIKDKSQQIELLKTGIQLMLNKLKENNDDGNVTLILNNYDAVGKNTRI